MVIGLGGLVTLGWKSSLRGQWPYGEQLELERVMRLIMFKLGEKVGLGASDGSVFRGFVEGEPGYPGDLDALIRSGEILAEAGGLLKSAPELELGAVTFLPPVRNPGKILCVGLNYRAHAQELGHGKEVKYPEIFARFASCLIGHEQPIVKPALSDKVDYEGELAVVIGRSGRGIAKDKALEHVAGYSIFNDVSIRDYQMRVGQWTMGKNFDSTGPFGPWLVTPDELPPGCAGLDIQSRLNGQVMQSSNTSKLIFDIPTLIEYLSAVMTLCPGDVIITGTPGGVGVGRDPQVFMKAGDRIEIEIEGVGLLANPVVA